MKWKKKWISLSLAMIVAANGLAANALAVQQLPAESSISVQAQADKQALKATDFKEIGLGHMDVDEDAGTLTLQDTNGDHFAMYDGLDSKLNDFTFEADLQFPSDSSKGYEDNGKIGYSAGLVFGTNSKTLPSGHWNAANVDTMRRAAAESNSKKNADFFRLFGAEVGGDIGLSEENAAKDNFQNIDATQKLHLKLDVKADGQYTYTFGNLSGKEFDSSKSATISGTLNNWAGGYIGLLSFNSEATFSNISLEDRTEALPEIVKTPISLNNNYKTNLSNFSSTNGKWEVKEDGLHSDASEKGDCFALSEVKGSNFVYSTDVTFDGDDGAAALVFRSDNDLDNKDAYAVNIAPNGECKFWKWEDDRDLQLIDTKTVPTNEAKKYTLKVVAYDSWILYYVNDALVASLGDYTLQEGDKGQDTFIKEGYFGLLNWNGKVTFQNTYYTQLTDNFNPLLNDITVTSSTGTVEGKSQFVPTEPITIQYVKNDARTVDVTAVPKNSNAVVTIKDASGKVYADGKNIPVAEGKNYITITSTVTADDDTTATMTYRVNVHRRQADEIYYNEPYRDQYHYSVKDGWGNDPNGLIYYNGTYHMFHQFYDDITWGPMHWLHLTSKDLLHWEEQPMALYPDGNGTMFSGCIVADENNTSGFFSGSKGGLVAIITADGNGQRMKLAYSTDEGKTWTKTDKIVADWTDDVLAVQDFRDPKVFRWENKWFMVVAGGPLRIYSSDNLKDWKCESAYPDLHTECPDLYPVQSENGTMKWVLSRGGRFYKIGDFKQVSGSWTFVPDKEYQTTDGVMNFGKDSYAAMTYYVQDFGTSANPTLPEIIELNWMNTWDYCNKVAVGVNQKFNGTYNLNLKAGLTQDKNGKYLLTQTPIQAYETLRDTEHATVLKDVAVTERNNLLDDFSGDSYEIVANFKPGSETKKLGFNLRTDGEDEVTKVTYDVEAKTLSIDRSKSGKIIQNNDNEEYGNFLALNSQNNVILNDDGSIDLHIYVDRASVEVFTNDYTVAGANQIFPSLDSLGLSAFVEGAAAEADITIYPMKSIWKTEAEEEPQPQPEPDTVCQAFTDVQKDQWYHDGVHYMVQNDWMKGMSDSVFGINVEVSRAMVAQILYANAEKPDVSGTSGFVDVPVGVWYEDAVAWAAKQGVVSGYGSGRFGPNDTVTREQLAQMLYANEDKIAVTGQLNFSDASAVSSWAKDGVIWATQQGIIEGTRQEDGTVVLDPKGQATRAQLAVMMMQYLSED